MIKNPVYVRADLDLYRFYKDQGTILHNSPEDYIGMFGCYLYSDKSAGRKTIHLEAVQHGAVKNYMDHWDELEFGDKREVVDQLILVIHTAEDSCEIKWRI